MAEVANRYTLKHPITVTFAGPDGEREEMIREITLRRPKGKDLRALDKINGDMAQGLFMIAQLSQLTAAQVDELDAEDIGAIGEIVDRFTPPGRATGGTSSGT